MRLSLRHKIAGGFALLLILMALLGWVTLSLFQSIRSTQRAVFADAIPGLVAVEEIVRSYTAQTAAVRGFLIQPQPGLLEQYRREVAQASVWQEEARGLFAAEEEQRLLGELVAAGSAFNALIEDEVIPLAEGGRRALAFSLLGQEGTPLVSEIETVGGRLRAQQDRVVAAAESDLRSRSNQALVILALVVAGGLIVGVALSILLPRRLGANIDRLMTAVRGIGRGDLDQQIEIRSGDEIEELAARFTEMQSGLKRLQQLALQDRELEIAASIQRNLLPRALPELEGVRLVSMQRQANLVGGDWYDADVSGSLLSVAVGDASGKGIGAALMATVALSALRAERRLGADPRRVMERTNEALKEATDTDSFTTVIYAVLDAASGELTWLNMGHPSPFVLRAEAPALNQHGAGRPRGYYLEGPRNRALGWFDDPGLAVTVVRMQPGDRLIFFTDGFLEAKSAEGEVFGEHRLADAIVRVSALELDQIGDELVREVEQFAAGKLDDDLTMLVLEFQGAPVREGVPRVSTGEEKEWHSRR